MPTERTYPGVYIEEVPTTPDPIEGVATSITAFAGWTPIGPNDGAARVVSWLEFETKFGGLDSRSVLGYSVKHFFENGGTEAYVVRIGDASIVVGPNQPAFEDALLPADGKSGLYQLDAIEIFNLLCVPGETNPTVIRSLQKFCLDRFAFLIVDCPEDAQYNDMKDGPGPIDGDEARNSALYFPWVLAADSLNSNLPREFPPSGYVAGIYARTDATRGVWKAPAGLSSSLNGIQGISPNKLLTDSQNATLNKKGINCIRTFPSRGTVVWGARTLRGADVLASEWKYVPVRRTSLFIERSIYEGTQWVVFEPNDEPLWSKIRLTVGSFMHKLFRDGAFQGVTPKEAYFVKCDRDTTSQNDIDAGVVNIYVGFAPLKPAEFVVIHLQQLTHRDDD